MEDFLSGVEKQLLSKSLHFLAIYWESIWAASPWAEEASTDVSELRAYIPSSPYLKETEQEDTLCFWLQLIPLRETNKRQRLTCHAVRQDVHIRWPHGSIFTSLSFSAHILHSWNVEPISQYNSYCSLEKRWTDVVDIVKQCAGFIIATRNPTQNGHRRNRLLWRKWSAGFPRFSFRCPKNSLGMQGLRVQTWWIAQKNQFVAEHSK